MKLADKPCYPFNIRVQINNAYGDTRIEQVLGLTFRERLILALASNPYYCVPKEEMAKNIVDQADAIIKELEK